MCFLSDRRVSCRPVARPRKSLRPRPHHKRSQRPVADRLLARKSPKPPRVSAANRSENRRKRQVAVVAVGCDLPEKVTASTARSDQSANFVRMGGCRHEDQTSTGPKRCPRWAGTFGFWLNVKSIRNNRAYRVYQCDACDHFERVSETLRKQTYEPPTRASRSKSCGPAP